MIELPRWAYYGLHALLALWFVLLLFQRDFVGAALLVVGYILGRLLREDEL